MTASSLTDEHVPRVFVSTLRSTGTPSSGRNVLGDPTEDERLLRGCAERGHVLVTHDRKDFGGRIGDAVDHVGIVVYTDPNYLRDRPEPAVRLVERSPSHYPPAHPRADRFSST